MLGLPGYLAFSCTHTLQHCVLTTLLSLSCCLPATRLQVVAAAVKDATTILSVMKVGTISVLAAAALMPVRNGFKWDAETRTFNIDPALRQVEPPVARLLELDKLPGSVSYTPSRNRQWHLYNCRYVHEWGTWVGSSACTIVNTHNIRSAFSLVCVCNCTPAC